MKHSSLKADCYYKIKSGDIVRVDRVETKNGIRGAYVWEQDSQQPFFLNGHHFVARVESEALVAQPGSEKITRTWKEVE